MDTLWEKKKSLRTGKWPMEIVPIKNGDVPSFFVLPDRVNSNFHGLYFFFLSHPTLSGSHDPVRTKLHGDGGPTPGFEVGSP